MEAMKVHSGVRPPRHEDTNNIGFRLSRFTTLWQKRIFVLFLFTSLCSYGQDVKVRGQFLADSIKIGEPFPYSLAVQYPADKNIIFPDSTYAFAPFEFAAKKYFATHTINGISYDSAIYYFNSFEIDSVQTLRLPVFVILPKDCTEVWAEPDMVWLKHLVAISLDSVQAANLPLKVNAYYEPVAWLFNYPVASIIGGVILIFGIVVWFIFGKRIRKFFKARSMRRSFEKYLKSFAESVEILKASYSITQAENALSIWKKYLESLEEIPFTKYTSKEILQIANNDNLAAPLKTVDRLLYAGIEPSSFDAFYELKSYSEDCFYRKLQEINSPGK